MMQNSEEAKKAREAQLSVREALSSKKEEPQKESGDEFRNWITEHDGDDEDDVSFDARMRRQILEKRKELGDLPPKPKSKSSSGIVCHPLFI